MGVSFRAPFFYENHSYQLDARARDLLKKHLQHMEEAECARDRTFADDERNGSTTP